MTPDGSTPELEPGALDRAIAYFACLPALVKGLIAAAVTALAIVVIASFAGGGGETPPPVPAGTPVPTSEPGGPIVVPPGEQLAR